MLTPDTKLASTKLMFTSVKYRKSYVKELCQTAISNSMPDCTPLNETQLPPKSAHVVHMWYGANTCTAPKPLFSNQTKRFVWFRLLK